jgi:hypothetical protein
VPEFELLERDDVRTLAGEVIGRGAPESAHTHDGNVE